MVIKERHRIFLTCRSKNCEETKFSKIRCTISMMNMQSRTDKQIASGLTDRRFCTMFNTAITLISNTPDWKVSPDKPGRKKLLAAERNEVADLDLLDLIGETGLEIT